MVILFLVMVIATATFTETPFAVHEVINGPEGDDITSSCAITIDRVAAKFKIRSIQSRLSFLRGIVIVVGPIADRGIYRNQWNTDYISVSLCVVSCCDVDHKQLLNVCVQCTETPYIKRCNLYFNTTF